MLVIKKGAYLMKKKGNSHNLWLIIGLSIAIIVILLLVLYSPVKTALVGKGMSIPGGIPPINPHILPETLPPGTVTMITGGTPIPNCGFSKWVKGGNYTLTKHLVLSSNSNIKTCLEPNRADITIDCQGKIIACKREPEPSSQGGTGTKLTFCDVGVKFVESGGFTLKNCIIDSFKQGIKIEGPNNKNIIYNNIIKNYFEDGIILVDSGGNNISQNTACYHKYSNVVSDFTCKKTKSNLNKGNFGKYNKFNEVIKCSDSWPTSKDYGGCTCSSLGDYDGDGKTTSADIIKFKWHVLFGDGGHNKLSCGGIGQKPCPIGTKGVYICDDGRGLATNDKKLCQAGCLLGDYTDDGKTTSADTIIFNWHVLFGDGGYNKASCGGKGQKPCLIGTTKAYICDDGRGLTNNGNTICK